MRYQATLKTDFLTWERKLNPFRSLLFTLGLACCFGGLSVVQAAAPAPQESPPYSVTLTDSQEVWDLEAAPFEAWLETRQQRFSAEQIAQAGPAALRSSSYGYRSQPAWFRLKVRNLSKQTLWHLRLHPRVLQAVDLWVFPSADLTKPEQKYTFRIGYAGQNGSLRRMTPTFEARMASNQEYLLVFKIQALEPLDLNLFIETPDTLRQVTGRVEMLTGMYVGLLLALMIYTLFIYRTLKESFFPHYLLFMGGMAVLVPALDGVPDFLVQLPRPFTDLIPIATATVCFAGNQFCRKFLRVEAFAPRLDRFQHFLARLCAAAIVLALPPFYYSFPQTVGTTNDVLLVSTVILIMICAVWAVRAGQEQSGIFLAAWVGFLLSCVLFIGATYGILPQGPFSRWIVKVGNVVEMLVLAYAISLRLKARELQGTHMLNMVRVLSHDLATPMGVVMTQTQVARAGGKPNWDLIERAVLEQRSILDFARTQDPIARGETPVFARATPLNEVIQSALLLFEKRAWLKGVTLKYEPNPLLESVQVWADATVLAHSVIGNALSNAVKFSRQSGEIRLEVSQPGDTLIEIRIEDDGVGMAGRTVRELKSKGRAAHRPGTEGEPGTGMGLRLIRYFVEGFSGSVDWKSPYTRKSPAGLVQSQGTQVLIRLKKVLE